LEALSLGFRRRSNVVLLVATPSHDSAAEYQSANPLAAVVGHELNNISVPLCGFTELAAGSTTLDESVRLCLDELRIAIARIKSIASDLESLAESESRAARPTIGKCLAAPGGDRASEPWNIDWLCPTNTVIAVDLLQAQRALEALARIAARAGPAIRAAVFLLPTDPSCNTRCVVCDATFARENGFVVIQAYGIRAIGVEVLIEPFVSERGGGGARRLNLAVLVHCAHAAGGHLLLDGSADSISVAFPQG
jgi:signal transduction histidine kinase